MSVVTYLLFQAAQLPVLVLPFHSLCLVLMLYVRFSYLRPILAKRLYIISDLIKLYTPILIFLVA